MPNNTNVSHALSTEVESSPSWFVQLDGDRIHIEGVGWLTTSQALRLAHTITDLVTP